MTRPKSNVDPITTPGSAAAGTPQFSLGEGLDVGCDIGSPIDFTYEMPFVFTGKIDKVTIELKPEASSKKANS